MSEIKSPSTIQFVKVGKGRLALYHRPRHDTFELARREGCTHVVTLLKDTEFAERYGEQAKNAGLEWYWLPVPNGKYPEGEVHKRLIAAMPELSHLLDEGKSLLIHCSAGIHRTGTVAYGLLRWRGIPSERATQIIRASRVETAEGMMDKRKVWGDKIANSDVPQESIWITSVKEFASQLKTRLFKPPSTPTPNAG
jgi:protein-tyrosine phosphatase